MSGEGGLFVRRATLLHENICFFPRWSFNLTLLIAGVFGVAAGGSPNFVSLAVLMSFVGVGVGGMSCRCLPHPYAEHPIPGNMPVDAAVFLGKAPNVLSRIVMVSQYVLSTDFVPGSHQYLLTILSIWWCLGQLLGNLVILSFVSA